MAKRDQSFMGRVNRYSRQLFVLLTYFAIPAMGAVAPLLVIPAISSRFGATSWASVAIAQSIGAAGAAIAELGWGVVGPQRVASTSGLRRIVIYRISLSSKLVATVVVAPIAGAAAYVIAIDDKLVATVLAVGMALTALTPSWFFIGEGSPAKVLLSESAPRVVFNVLSALMILAGLPLMTYGLTMLAVPLVTLGIAALLIGKLSIPRARDFRNVPKVIRKQLVLVSGRGLSVLYTTLPISMVGAFVPGAVPLFAATERLMRMALAILTGIPSRLQSWIGGSADRAQRNSRSRSSIWLNLVLGVVCGFFFALLAPFVSHFIFAGAIDIPISLSALSGFLMMSICFSRGLGLSLVAAARANSITTATLMSAIVAIGSVVPLSFWLGAHGAVLGEILAEVTGIAVQLAILRKALPSRRQQPLFAR
ncbi:hypothetical protein KPL76_05860 [Subtercola sp. PAMC28395]|uniref:hypothetical protein n=1 Tax=Subtercola sp. PAMC28395 TaxID=2846775 RepID=UPI001C0E30D0|nr:hypothetical protein [Subtercola sp. PAMC28395]QWT24883.1 hypothetical protein KPL76_05860 [Subtercola sp. PAMC28395]